MTSQVWSPQNTDMLALVTLLSCKTTSSYRKCLIIITNCFSQSNGYRLFVCVSVGWGGGGVGLSMCISQSTPWFLLSITTHLISLSEEAAVLWPLILLNCCSVLPDVNPQVSKPLSHQPQRSVFTASIIKRWKLKCQHPAQGWEESQRATIDILLSVLPSISLFVWTLSPSHSVSLPSLYGALYLSPPGFNLKFCLSLNSHVISCQARRGSVCTGFGFYTELPMFSTHPPSNLSLSFHISIPPSLPSLYTYISATFPAVFNAYLFRKHMLSVIPSHFPTLFFIIFFSLFYLKECWHPLCSDIN